MEGVLLKWTNYFSGWQPRYFVLEGLFLTCYLCKEDVGEATEGSMKMALCEIKVHPTDSRRFDLHFPGEQCLSLMEQRFGDRRRWLVALGSAKACLRDQQPEVGTELAGGEDCLRRKMSELQLCCHLLVEQVHVLQGFAQPLEKQAQTQSATASSLRETCSEFLGALEECMNTCSCSTVPQSCALAPPVSHSAVSRSRQQHRLQLTLSATQTEGAVAERPVLDARSGETVKRNIAEMATLHTHRRSIRHVGHQGAHLTISNDGDRQQRLHTEDGQSVAGRQGPPITTSAPQS